MATSSKTKDNEKFSVLYSELEYIIQKLESGELELEDSLNEYSKGVKILAQLQAKLDDSEVIINKIAGEIDRDTDSLDNSSVSHA
ncbi:exodeoxyribonuclease VII small subunit [Phoenicibacter congonensis]|uniref:exodeoxyribonuclease VII small subunit n=1 Tax=Phoenicibacter congonensis TaxID=1944646 RepID=UPI0009A560A4|nr:exodeoxyribonuclease VII small subunit [Phoenicibacter congonensis]